LHVGDLAAAAIGDAGCASPQRCLSSHANRPERGRGSDVALPDCSVVELDRHAVRRIDGAHVPVIGPDLGERRKRIGPGTGRLTGFVDEIEIPSVLRDKGEAADRSHPTPLDAPIRAGQIDRLCRCRGCREHGRGRDGA
jgi:hypothetical protein